MERDLKQEIKMLQKEIEGEENKINDSTNDSDSVKKSLAIIHSDLKYLSIIINGAPIEPKENMKIRNFLQIHYENLWRIPVSM